jgi:hypothetical protein
MSREELIAACKAQRPHSPEWMAAVVALGRARAAGFLEPTSAPVRKGWRATLTGILRSHHFNGEERRAFTERVDYEYGSEVLYKQITQTVSEREKKERAAKRAAKREVTA